MTDTIKKTVYAEYRGMSHFEIPSDVTEYEIKWNKLTYEDKNGVEHEVEPSLVDVEEDTELFKRPSDEWCETDEAYKDEPTDSFYDYFDDMTREDILAMLWNRMKVYERKEILDFMKAKEEDNEEEDEEN